MKTYNIRPFPAVRSNKNTWTKSVKDYHEKMNHLRLLVGPDKEKIIQSMILDGARMVFSFELPKSWSKKKKKQMEGQEHKQKPDLDNLIKAVKDTIFYKHPVHNDCEVSRTNSGKFWAREGEESSISIDF